jgi:hypothetical protein
MTCGSGNGGCLWPGVRQGTDGQGCPATSVSQQDRCTYQEKVRHCLNAFAQMLREPRFEPIRADGPGIELNLVDEFGLPSMANTAVPGAIAGPS